MLEKYDFCIISRNDTVSNLINKKYLKYKNKFKIIDYHNNTSSTMVRDFLKNNQDTKNILDKDVFNYIKENHLY